MRLLQERFKNFTKTTGVIHDSEEGARKMQLILEKNSTTYEFKEVKGHSWGNWRDLIDDFDLFLSFRKIKSLPLDGF